MRFAAPSNFLICLIGFLFIAAMTAVGCIPDSESNTVKPDIDVDADLCCCGDFCVAWDVDDEDAYDRWPYDDDFEDIAKNATGLSGEIRNNLSGARTIDAWILYQSPDGEYETSSIGELRLASGESHSFSVPAADVPFIIPGGIGRAQIIATTRNNDVPIGERRYYAHNDDGTLTHFHRRVLDERYGDCLLRALPDTDSHSDTAEPADTAAPADTATAADSNPPSTDDCLQYNSAYRSP